MKQRITTEQLEQLTDDQYVKLYRFVRPTTKMKDWTIICGRRDGAARGVRKDLNVGNLIGFIGHLIVIIHPKLHEIAGDEKVHSLKDGEWVWNVEVYTDDEFSDSIGWIKPELVDALWEAVKYVMGEVEDD